LHFPPRLRPGDVILVVAPSGPPKPDELFPGLAWLRTRYRIRMSPGVLQREGFLAGDDARRRNELVYAMKDPEASAVVVARGGYGALRIAKDLPWDELARRPKWIVGYSDVTVLHAMAWRAGVASVHAPNVSDLPLATAAVVRQRWIVALEEARVSPEWTGLRVVRPGEASGVAVGGNLTLLHAMAAAGCLTMPAGAVLFLEDVAEAPYRLDRMLTSLEMGGHFRNVSAVVLGGFDRCSPRADGRSADHVLIERTRALGVPVVAGAPFGHNAGNQAFVLGSVANVTGDSVRFTRV
jgi:muramoyltetrapeptide carboxypeptidase